MGGTPEIPKLVGIAHRHEVSRADRAHAGRHPAFAEQMAEAREDFSIPRVANRAGASTRTVYHHFPNREAQVEALAARIERRLGPADGPKDLHDMADFQERLIRRFGPHSGRVARESILIGAHGH